MQLQFAVGFKLHDKASHVIVDAEDALIAALKVKDTTSGGTDHICPPAKQKG